MQRPLLLLVNGSLGASALVLVLVLGAGHERGSVTFATGEGLPSRIAGRSQGVAQARRSHLMLCTTKLQSGQRLDISIAEWQVTARARSRIKIELLIER